MAAGQFHIKSSRKKWKCHPYLSDFLQTFASCWYHKNQIIQEIWACNSKRFHVCRERLRMTFLVHKMTSRLARTLQIGTDKVFCTRNPKITFKIPKNQLFLSYCTCLPKFECETTKPQKSKWHYWKMKIFFFRVFYTVWTFSHRKMKSCSFSIVLFSQFNFKNGHFFSRRNHTVLLFPLKDK